MAGHVYFKTGDADAPDYIKDRNGEVVLGMCKLCRKAENELGDICEAAAPATREELIGLLREADKEFELCGVDQDAHCEHDVGVCSCSYRNMRVRMRQALVSESKIIKARSFADFMAGKPMEVKIVSGDDIMQDTSTTYREEQQDKDAVANFSEAMLEKLARKAKQGRGGWKDAENCTTSYLADLLVEHVHKGDPVDIGNLAMMLHQRGALHSQITEALNKLFQVKHDILVAGRNDMRKAIAFAIQEDDAYNGIAFLEAWEQGNHLEEWPEYATFEVKP